MVDTTRPNAPVIHADGAEHRRQIATVVNLINQSTPDYRRTPAEIAAEVTVVDYRRDEPYPLRYGTNTTPGSTDMRAALQAAYKVGAATGKEVVIDQAYFVDINDENDPLVMTSGLTVRFTEEGSIKYDFFGLPCMYADEQDGIRLINPHMIYAATAATSLPAANAAFHTATGHPTVYGPSVGNSTLLFIGCDNTTIVNPRFTNAVVSNTTVHSRCISFSEHADGTKAFNNHIAGRMYIEAAHFGVLAWGQDHFTIDDLHQWKYGQLDIDTYTWEAAGHSLYLSHAAANTNFRIDRGYDEGITLSGAAIEGCCSFKIRRVDGFHVGSLTSYRDQGVLDITAKHGSIGRVYWKGASTTAFAAAEPFRFISSNGTSSSTPISKENEDLHFGTVVLHYPDVNDQIINGSAGNGVADFIYRLTIDNLVIICDGTAMDTGKAPFTLSATDSHIKSTWFLPNLTQNIILCRIDDGGSNNRLEATVVDGPFNLVRMSENDRATSTGNSLTVIDGQTGDRRTLNNHTAFEVRTVSEVLTNVSGATVTATNLIPAGAFVIGLTTIITEALGATGGTTGYSVGDGSDADRWGLVNSVAANTGSENDNWTAGGNNHFTAAQSVVITAVGGNFDGTGAIRVGITYMIGKLDSNLQGAA